MGVLRHLIAYPAGGAEAFEDPPGLWVRQADTITGQGIPSTVFPADLAPALCALTIRPQPRFFYLVHVSAALRLKPLPPTPRAVCVTSCGLARPLMSIAASAGAPYYFNTQTSESQRRPPPSCR